MMFKFTTRKHCTFLLSYTGGEVSWLFAFPKQLGQSFSLQVSGFFTEGKAH